MYNKNIINITATLCADLTTQGTCIFYTDVV